MRESPAERNKEKILNLLSSYGVHIDPNNERWSTTVFFTIENIYKEGVISKEQYKELRALIDGKT